jgi:hypothetical protein
MNSAEYVTKLIADLKAKGEDLSKVAYEAAKACVGWPYVFGARWAYCTPANRRARYSDDHPTIKTACANFNGSGSAGCAGCKWYPKSKYTRINDCRGFTYGILKAVFGWELMGAGATTQWDKASNWVQKGKVADGIPKDTIVCLFYPSKTEPKKMAHTGLCYNNETIECSAGVQYSKTINKKWTDWGVPACVTGDIPTPVPPEPTYPTLRKGSSGTYVTLCQTKLIQRGYSCGKSGADGKYGSNTVAAVKAFQRDNGLTPDGITGEKTWAALMSTEPTVHYTVTIPGLVLSVANGLMAQYPNAIMKEE